MSADTNAARSYSPSNECSSPLPFPALSTIATIPTFSRKGSISMGEVWKDVSLSSLHHLSTTNTTSSPLLGLSFQDCLSTPPVRERAGCSAVHGHRSQTATSEPWLSLNSPRDQFPCDESSNPRSPNPYGQTHPLGKPAGRQSPKPSCQNRPLGKAPRSLAVSPVVSLSPRTFEFEILKKGIPESEDSYSERMRRLIKSRECADRCRARKQAHTQELEIKFQRLKRENAELKRELQKKHFPKKQKLQRTLTAPF